METKKIKSLEGMRALMALNVILCHFVCSYYPQMYFKNHALQSGGFLSCFANTPLSALVNGNVAVCFFFALTGFLVGCSSFSKKITMQDLEIKVVKRYTRLLPIIILATLFSFLCMILKLNQHINITNSKANTGFLLEYNNFSPNALNLILSIFFTPILGYNRYIGPFWTIIYEFWGYVICVNIAYIFKESKYRRIWYLTIIGLLIYFTDDYYPMFVMGLIVSDIIFNKNETILNKYYNKIFNSKIFVLICFLIGTYFAVIPLTLTPSYYAFWLKIPYITDTLLRGFGISIEIFVIVKSKFLSKILSFKPLVFLGEFSFEVYALHWPLMLSLQAALFNAFIKKLSYDIAAILAFIVVLPFIYLISFGIHVLIKRFTKFLFTLKLKKTSN